MTITLPLEPQEEARLIAAAEALHEKARERGPLPPVTKADWDALNEIPGFAEDDD